MLKLKHINANILGFDDENTLCGVYIESGVLIVNNKDEITCENCKDIIGC